VKPLAQNAIIVVCTSAFGMGSPDVGLGGHFHAPLLLSEYVQEMDEQDGMASKYRPYTH